MSDCVENRLAVDVDGETWTLVNEHVDVCEWRLFRGSDTTGPGARVIFYIGTGLHSREHVPRGVLAAFRQPVRDWYRRVLDTAIEHRDRWVAALDSAEKYRAATRQEYERALEWHHTIASVVKDISCEVDS